MLQLLTREPQKDFARFPRSSFRTTAGGPEGRAIEHEHKKGGGLRKQEEDTLRAKLPLFRAGPTCLIERFPNPAKVQEEEASLCASQDTDLAGQRWGLVIYPFKMAFWVAATERSSTEPL